MIWAGFVTALCRRNSVIITRIVSQFESAKKLTDQPLRSRHPGISSLSVDIDGHEGASGIACCNKLATSL